MAPITKPAMFLPKILTENSRRSDSATIAIIGPKIMALGDIVFIIAQIRPARQKMPRSRQI
ncbi:MAG: hypothetical protein MZV64_28690 [Ignavibacteriales bacterium]|nr:hypothetical protein [Ignavibacteriales bacterium]